MQASITSNLMPQAPQSTSVAASENQDLAALERARDQLIAVTGFNLNRRSGELEPTTQGLSTCASSAGQSAVEPGSLFRAHAYHVAMGIVVSVFYCLVIVAHVGNPILASVVAVLAFLAGLAFNNRLGDAWSDRFHSLAMDTDEQFGALRSAVAWTTGFVVIDFATIIYALSLYKTQTSLLAVDSENGTIFLRVLIALFTAAGAAGAAHLHGKRSGNNKAHHQMAHRKLEYLEGKEGARTRLSDLIRRIREMKDTARLAAKMILLLATPSVAFAQQPAIVVFHDCTASMTREILTPDGHTRAEVMISALAGMLSDVREKRLLVLGFSDSRPPVLLFDNSLSRRTTPELRDVLTDLEDGCLDGDRTDLVAAIGAATDLMERIENRVLYFILSTDGLQTASGSGQADVYRALEQMAERLRRTRLVRLTAVVGVNDDTRLGYTSAVNAFADPTKGLVASMNDFESKLAEIRRVLRDS